MNEYAAVGPIVLDLGESLGDGRLQIDGRTVTAGRVEINLRRILRHYYDGIDAEPAGRKRDRLSVIAAADGDHAAATLFVRHREQLVERTADLERAGEL